MRILFISGEVTPFTKASELGDLVRTLPEQLCENGDYETRILMPRYGIVSERRNRLHEVIRLSGTEVQTGDRSETLKVKVASIPGIRLQVYFMDNAYYFKRKGIWEDRKTGKLFEDNPDRALFFGRGVIETIRKLGWKPDLVHAFGWMSGLVPMLLRTEYAADPLFEEAKVIYTPETVSFDGTISEERATKLDLPASIAGQEPYQVGLQYADATIYPASMGEGGDASFGDPANGEALMQTAAAVYEQVQIGVPA